MAPDVVTVLTTTARAEQAETLARSLLDARLIACANVLPGATSLYRWDGRVQKDDEVVVIMKSTHERLELLKERLLEEHPYDVPEVIVLPVVDGSRPYLDWVRQEVGP